MKKNDFILLNIFLMASITLAGCAPSAEPKSISTEPKNGSLSQVVPLTTPSTATSPASLTSATIILNGPRTSPKIALTFDADMTPKMLQELKNGKVKSWYDPAITNLLEQNNIPSTVFMTGMWAETYPEIVKKLSQNPLYEIGNHSYDHSVFKTPCYSLGQATDKNAEITKTQKILTDLTGKTPRFFRFPGGCYDQKDLDLVAQNGLKTAGWDVVSGDSYLKDPKKIINIVLTKTQNGSIIVMHFDDGPTSPATGAALPAIIEGLKKKGFTFVTLSDLLSQQQ